MVPWLTLALFGLIGLAMGGGDGLAVGFVAGLAFNLVVGVIVRRVQGGIVPKGAREAVTVGVLMDDPDLVHAAFPSADGQALLHNLDTAVDRIARQAIDRSPSPDTTTAFSTPVVMAAVRDVMAKQSTAEMRHLYTALGDRMVREWYGHGPMEEHTRSAPTNEDAFAIAAVSTAVQSAHALCAWAEAQGHTLTPAAIALATRSFLLYNLYLLDVSVAGVERSELTHAAVMRTITERAITAYLTMDQGTSAAHNPGRRAELWNLRKLTQEVFRMASETPGGGPIAAQKAARMSFATALANKLDTTPWAAVLGGQIVTLAVQAATMLAEQVEETPVTSRI